MWLGQAVSNRVRARGTRVLMVFFMVGLFWVRQPEMGFQAAFGVEM